MLHQTLTNSLPRIIVGETEELRLSSMATAAELTGRAENAAKALLAEMARAHVVEDSEVPEGVVRMHSLVDTAAVNGQ
jgi:regulator of nucleoside diphosphate kinase